MSEEPITAEQVAAIASVHLGMSMAGRIAAYANHRAAGFRPADAREAIGVSEATGTRYESWTRLIRDTLGLPPLRTGPSITPAIGRDMAAAGQRGLHTRWHTGRGVTSPDCPLCTGEGT